MVAQQILAILLALSTGQARFVFEGREIDLVWSCGIFITMNPGMLNFVNFSFRYKALSLSVCEERGRGKKSFVNRRIVFALCLTCFTVFYSGYAGRTELPDNLKSMFRPIAMVVPDSGMISEIILFGEGFGNTRVCNIAFLVLF